MRLMRTLIERVWLLWSNRQARTHLVLVHFGLHVGKVGLGVAERLLEGSLLSLRGGTRETETVV